MSFDIITIFPEILNAYLNESIIKRARNRGLLTVLVHNIRDCTDDNDKRKNSTSAAARSFEQIDDKPYGGGAGMVLMAEPILKTVEHIRSIQRGTAKKREKEKIIILSAKGKQFNQRLASQWAKKHPRIIMIAGRYEGIDERVRTVLHAEEVSVGPYVLTDGDVAAMVIVSAVSRLIPGVINLASLAEESHWNLLLKKELQNTGAKALEYPQYTRPEVFEHNGKNYRVPKVLLSGDHKRIAEWREKKKK